jgi:hypothetical protein
LGAVKVRYFAVNIGSNPICPPLTINIYHADSKSHFANCPKPSYFVILYIS